MTSLEAARAGHAALRLQLIQVMSQTDGTEHPDLLVAMYDASLRRVHEAEMASDASFVRDKRNREAANYAAKSRAFTGA
jgi:hypothetical protein